MTKAKKLKQQIGDLDISKFSSLATLVTNRLMALEDKWELGNIDYVKETSIKFVLYYY